MTPLPMSSVAAAGTRRNRHRLPPHYMNRLSTESWMLVGMLPVEGPDQLLMTDRGQFLVSRDQCVWNSPTSARLRHVAHAS
jgi:hypothetical protein